MKKTLVIGASTNPSRYSHMAIHRLVAKGYDVVALGLREGTVADISIHTEKEHFPDIDTVTLYIGPKHQPSFYDYLVRLKPRRVIFNPGTENQNFYSILRQENILVEVACTLVLLGTNQY